MLDPITLLKYQAEDEGYEPGTDKFEFRFLTLRVEACKGKQSVSACSECKAYWDCALAKQLLQWKAFGPPERK